jgi:predicted RNase H-like HicB family nuclease
MANQPSQPLRLTVVYEPAEEGWTTATIPAVPGTLSAGSNQRKARENVLDALREMLSAPPEVPQGAFRVEQVEIRLEVERAIDRGHER